MFHQDSLNQYSMVQIQMSKLKSFGIEIGIIFAVVFISLVVLVTYFLPVEINTSLTFELALFSLIVTMFVVLYHHKVAHAGHLFLVVGILVLLWSIMMIYGSFSFGEKEKMWTLSDPEIALYTFLGIIGMIAFLDGVKQMWGARYFIRGGRGNR